MRDIMTSTSMDFLHWTEPVWLEYPGAAPEFSLYATEGYYGKGPGLGTRRSKRPTLAQLETWCAIGREAFQVRLIRHATVEGHMRPVLIVPVDRELNRATEGCGSKWHPR